ncbi:MAG: PQQ-binding-like beta-propeller repeat protein [Pirellulaceae bacterium]
MRYPLVILALILIPGVAGADWLEFRGPNGSGAAPEAKLPTEWSAEGKNVAWKAELPGRGPASPIVVGDRVIVTGSSGATQQVMHVVCFAVSDGKKLWERKFWATGRPYSHQQSSNAAPTPVSDGESVVAFFSSNDLVCLDLDGNLKWFRGLAYDHPKTGNDVGMASSPVIADNTVILQVENQGDSFATGLDLSNGETRWLIPRLEQANWASPVVIPSKEGASSVAILQNSKGLDGVDAYSGEVLWTMKTGASTISSSSSTPDQLFVPAGGLTVLDVSNPREEPPIAWEANKLSLGSVSPVLHNGKVYTINRVGVLNCANAEDGEIAWSSRLKGPFWASPVLAGKYLYCASFEGVVQVVDVESKKGEIVSTIEMGEQIQATPAIAGNALYLRSDTHLWKIAAE